MEFVAGSMNGLDWVLVVIGLFCIGRGMMRGAISQIFGIVGVLGGFLLASHFFLPLSEALSRSFPKLSGPQVISFIVLLFLTWFCIGTIGFMIARLVQRTGLGFMDRLWGALVGAGKALALAMALISVLTFFLSPKNPILNKSILAPHVQKAARFVVNGTPESVQKLFSEKQRELKHYWMDRERSAPRSPQLYRFVNREEAGI